MTLERNRRDLLRTIPGIAAAGLGLPGVAASQEGDGGEELWRFGAGARVDSSPTIVDGTVYVGNSIDSLFAIDAETGDQQWRFRADGDVRTAPQVVGDTVYVGSFDANVYAVDAATGEEVWRFETGDNVNSSPTVADVSGGPADAADGATAFVGSDDGFVYAIDADAGEEVWRFDAGDIVRSSPTVVDGLVFVGGFDFAAFALEAATGEQVWRFDTHTRVDASPTVVDGTAFVPGGTSRHDCLTALDARTGTELWSLEGGGSAESASPTVLDGTVYVLGGDDVLYATDAATGDVQWDFETRFGIGSAPTVADGVVFVADRYERITALDASTGEELWSFTESESRFVGDCQPTVAEGTVYVGSYEDLLAIDAGVDGSSEGSRVRLGTLGHTGAWTGQSDQTIETPDLEVGIEHLRLVQTVEHTRALAVRETEDRFADYAPAAEALVLEDDHPDVAWTALEPSFAAARQLAPVFDLSVSEPDAVRQPVTIRGRLVRDGESLLEQTAEIAPAALAGEDAARRSDLAELYDLEVPDRLPLLEVLAGNPDLVDGEYPTLLAAGGYDVEVEAEVNGPGTNASVTERVSIDPDRVEQTGRLSIGVVALRKGAITAEGSYRFDGEPDVAGFAERIARYLLDTYPVTGVDVAVYETPLTGPSANFPIAPNRAANIAERKLNARLDEATTFRLDDDDGERIDYADVGAVDVTLGVVPREEFFSGFLQGGDRHGALPLAFGRPVADAALVEIGRPVVAAHEIGHYLLGHDHFAHPDVAMDGDDAAHADESLRSTGYVHRDGDLAVHPARTSVMHTSGDQWMDALTYQGLVDSDFRPFDQSGVVPNFSISHQREVDRLLADVEIGLSAPDASTLEETSVDVDSLRTTVDDLRASLASGLDATERYWEAPDGLASGQWEQVREVAGDLERLGDELPAADHEFLAENGTTTAAADQQLAATAGALRDRADEWLEVGVSDVLEVTGSPDGDAGLSTEVLRVVGEVEPGDGDGDLVVTDAEGSVVAEGTLATDVEVVLQDGDRQRIDGAVTGAVPLPDDATTVEVAADTDAGTVSARIDPTTDPIRNAVEALPDRAFADAGARGDALATLDRIGDLVAGGDRDAAVDRLQALSSDLQDAIREPYEPEAADEPTREAVLDRVGQQVQRFGGEVPDAPGDGGDGTGDGEEETGEGGSGTGGDGGSGTWLLALGGVAVGGYAVKRLWDDREPVEPEE